MGIGNSNLSIACSRPYFLGTAAATAALAANNLGGSGIGTTVNQTAFGSASTNHGLKPVQTTTNQNTAPHPTTKVQVNEALNTTIPNTNGTKYNTNTPKIPPPIPPRKNSKKSCHQRAAAVAKSILMLESAFLNFDHYKNISNFSIQLVKYQII